MKYSLLCGAAFAALALGGVSARGQVLLYSFEVGDSPNTIDGFGPNGLLPSSSTIGATNGSNSLKLISPAGGYSDAYTTANLPAPLSNPALSAITMDVTIPATPAYAGNYSNLFFGFYISNPGEGEYGDQYVIPNTDWPNLDLAPGTYLGVTMPVTGNDPDTGLPTTWANMLAAGWYASGFIIGSDSDQGQTFYVDNVQAVVPEPASLALIGVLGGLTLTRRRRST